MGLGEGSLQRLVGGGGDLKTGQFSGQKGPLGSRKEKASGGPGFPGRQGVGSHTCKVDSDRFLNTYCVPGSSIQGIFQAGIQERVAVSYCRGSS